MSESTETQAAPTTAEIRTWARDHGYEVGTRGRLTQVVKDAYAEAHQG